MKFNKFLTPVQSLVVIAVLNTACGKYPEGPGFSLRSKAGRLEGDWTVTDVEGEPNAGSAAGLVEFILKREGATMTFEREGDFSVEASGSEQGSYTFNYYGYSYTITYDLDFDLDIEGDWEWGRDKESIELEGDYEVEITFGYGGSTYTDVYSGNFETEFELLRLTNQEIIMEDEDRDEWEMEKD